MNPKDWHCGYRLPDGQQVPHDPKVLDAGREDSERHTPSRALPWYVIAAAIGVIVAVVFLADLLNLT